MEPEIELLMHVFATVLAELRPCLIMFSETTVALVCVNLTVFIKGFLVGIYSNSSTVELKRLVDRQKINLQLF